MTIQFRARQHATAAIRETTPPADIAAGFRSRTLAQPGLLLKRLVLLAGAVYFSFVAVTNAVNFIASAGGFHWTFLNSGNVAYIASVTKIYSWPTWADKAVVLVAALAEGFGAFLFVRAMLRFRGGAIGIRAVWLALSWNIAVWLGFIVGTEFFVAYQSEGPFRELLAIALLMPVIIAVVPDSVPADEADRAARAGAPDMMTK
jgi:hypothetical protein